MILARVTEAGLEVGWPVAPATGQVAELPVARLALAPAWAAHLATAGAQRLARADLAETGGVLTLLPPLGEDHQAAVLVDVLPGATFGAVRGGVTLTAATSSADGGYAPLRSVPTVHERLRVPASRRALWMPPHFAGVAYSQRILLLDAGATLRIARWGVLGPYPGEVFVSWSGQGIVLIQQAARDVFDPPP